MICKDLEKRNQDVIGLIPAAGRGYCISPLPGRKQLFPSGFLEMRQGDETQLRHKVISQYLIDNTVQASARKIFTVLARGETDIMDYHSSSRHPAAALRTYWNSSMARNGQTVLAEVFLATLDEGLRINGLYFENGE